jgi:hypothetical protein
MSKMLLTLATLLVVSPSVMRAYADPGTGAFLYQAAYAAVLSGMFYFRRIITRFWGKRK